MVRNKVYRAHDIGLVTW